MEVSQEKYDELNRCLDVLDLFLQNGKWVAGDLMTLADLHALPTITNLTAAGVDVIRNCPNIAEWLDRSQSIPGFEENWEGAKLAGSMFKRRLNENLETKLPKIEP